MSDLIERIRNRINGAPMQTGKLLDEAAERITSLEEEVRRTREALAPSGDTKAAYSGEFQFNVEYSDEDGGSIWQAHLVPWTTVKEIMAAIRVRAALSNNEGEK